MFPQQPFGAGPYPYAGANGANWYPPPPSMGQLNQTPQYPALSQHMLPPEQQLQQTQQALMGLSLSQPTSPMPQPGPTGPMAALPEQQQQPQQQQPAGVQESGAMALQQATALPSGVYPAVPGTSGGTVPLTSGGGGTVIPGGVPMVPPAGGLCSRAPPSAEEVAWLQSRPLSPSKFSGLNNPTPATAAAAAAAATQPLQLRSRSAPGARVVDPQFMGPAPLEEKYGPYLRYGGYDPATRVYSASVMMIIHQSRSCYPPTLKCRDTHRTGLGEEAMKSILLWSYAGYNFWRWDMRYQLGTSPAVGEYYVVCSEDHWFTPHERYHFHLPAANQKWHWGFYSCNGFHDSADEQRSNGIQPLWRDVMNVHMRDPLHVMVGGGDQLYCDDVWKVNSLVQWLNIKHKPSRNEHAFTETMVNEVFDFYFRNYTTHFGKEVFRDALASIPQVMVWDDHDIFDGWGSYPPELQNCPVFAGVYFVARKFYLLFQNHAAEDNYRELNKGWGLTGLSWTVMLGNTTAVVGLDSRGERTRDQIIRPATWAAFADQVAKLPAGVRHVVVVAAVPLVYPNVPGAEEAMMALAGTGLMVSALTVFLQKTGLSSHIYSQFGEPELLDDLLDHWSAKNHEWEKYCFVKLMQDLAKARGVRFSILSGDVHCAGVAAFQTMPKVNLKTDHRYMVQVISSAIGNVPPPDALIKLLNASSKSKMLDTVTREKMRGVFENNSLLKASRNWCDIHERPLLSGGGAMMAGGVSGGPADGSLVFQLRVEHPVYKEVRVYTYDIAVPVLELPVGTFSPVPLPVAPPLPHDLMVNFQQELGAAGVGLNAALPVSAAPQGGQPGQQQAPLQPVMSPAGWQQEFGLQSDINQQLQQQREQQQEQQSRGFPPVQPPAVAGYPPGPPQQPWPAPAVQAAGVQLAPHGVAPPPPMYGVIAAPTPQPAVGSVAVHPSMDALPSTSYATPSHPQQPGYASHPQQPQQGQMPYPMYAPLGQPQPHPGQHPLAGPTYPLQGPAGPYPQPGIPPGPGYAPVVKPYPSGPLPPPPYGMYSPR